MTRAHLLLALSAIAGTAAALPASDCDCQKTSKCVTCDCIRDDRGLLDVVDSVAGRIHSGVRKSLTNLGRLPEKMQPSGCHCEVKKKGCDCSKCHSGGNTQQYYSESSVTPPMDNLETNSSGHSIIPQSDIPTSIKVPQPLPDSSVNPFEDEPVRSGQNRVRGRTIQYRSNNTNRPGANSRTAPRAAYGQQYNSQASHTPTTADYWAESSQLRPLKLVAPASDRTQTMEEVFRPAYRISLNDSDDRPVPTTKLQTNGLRPVPTHNYESSDAGIRQQADPAEHRTIVEQPVYDNPLRR